MLVYRHYILILGFRKSRPLPIGVRDGLPGASEAEMLVILSMIRDHHVIGSGKSPTHLEAVSLNDQSI